MTEVLNNIPSCPPFLDIDLTNQCNAACKFCSVSATKQKTIGELSGIEWVNFFQTFRGYPLFKVALLGGEPLMVPNLDEIISELTTQDVDTMVSTNGILLNEKKISSLSDAGLGSIQVSIDSPVPTEHDMSRGKVGLFNKVLKGIELAKKFNIVVTINFIAKKSSLHHLKKIADLAQSLDSGLVVSEYKPIGKGSKLFTECLSQKEVSTLLDFKHPYLSFAPFFHGSKNKMYCSVGLDRLYVDEIGDIYPCDLFKGNNQRILGNIRKNEWSEIWTHSNELNQLRQFKHQKSMPDNEVCGSCTDFNSCKSGCLALSQEHKNNAYSGDPRCFI